jgi:hypothetical protein
MNSWRAPTGIGHAHLADQIDDFPRHGRPTQGMAALPAPIQAESASMPGDDGFGFDDYQGRSPPTPQSREPDPQESVSSTQTQFVGTTRALKDENLKPESHKFNWLNQNGGFTRDKLLLRAFVSVLDRIPSRQ